MKEWLKSLVVKPSAAVLAQRELAEAERAALQHQSAAEFHGQMAMHYRGKIKRLSAYLGREV